LPASQLFHSPQAVNEGATYLWSNGETSQTVVIDSTGMDANHEKIVSVMVSDEFCSASDEVLVSYQDCSGINELTSLKDITVYPNPSHGKFEISLQSKDAQEVQIEILNMLGSVVYTENLSLNHGDNIHSIDISDLSAQSYLLIIKTVEGKMVQRILID